MSLEITYDIREWESKLDRELFERLSKEDKELAVWMIKFDEIPEGMFSK